MSIDLAPRAFPGDRPVLLVHGLAVSAEQNWLGVVDALSAAGRGALLVHLPGHPGGARAARGELALADLVEALAAVIRESGQERADVVAHSLGARIAWALAAGGAVSRLVIDGIAPTDPFAALDADALTAAVRGAQPIDPMTGMFARLVQAPGLDTDSVIALIEGVGATRFDPGLDQPRVPTLIIGGADDVMARGGDRIAAGLPAGTFLEVPGDHEGALTSPEYARAVAGFLS
ncbi:MAG: alpha/beta fold hydrolase [Microbacteriaceae bacterium]